MSISLLALLAAASCSDKDANDTSVPVAYRGQNVRSMETDISEGKRATFYFSDKGFLPASTKRVEM
ncbi:MAG: hypothetical protein KA144_07745, partial [Xanthomonadaceae bacterium]|nr:hypothetical protein [Xanthomonadaceae bacterium]